MSRVPLASAIIDTKALTGRRARLMKTIARTRGNSASSTALLERARELIGARYWARADWRRRAQILAASEWLVKLAERSGEIGTTGLF
jgi:Trm5-related predicted tRNA methylase